MVPQNIFPNRDEFVKRVEKEKIIKQKGIVIWFTGLPGSGKSTLAKGLEEQLKREDFLTQVLDGDKIRNGLSSDLQFSSTERKENIRRISEVSKLFCDCGVITISAFISPTEEIRQITRKIIDEKDYFEVFISTPLFNCEKRDTKGLYKKARRGSIKDFTGISAPFEKPKNPDLEINTVGRSIKDCVDEIYNAVIDRITCS